MTAVISLTRKRAAAQVNLGEMCGVACCQEIATPESVRGWRGMAAVW